LPWNVLKSTRPVSKPRLPSGRRIYAVGDVHGRADLLAELLARIDQDLRARPTTGAIEVLLGDYIDRGSSSRQVIDMLIARRRRRNLMLLMGNHEAFVLRVLRNPRLLSQWTNIGGLNTVLSYGVTPPCRRDSKSDRDLTAAFVASLPESHRRFLQGLALSFCCGDFFFVHAGVRPGIPLREQSQHDLLWIRDEFLLHEDGFGKIVVHGHTPTQEPDVRPNRINIDTGAYATGRLTCLVLEDDQVSFLS
jgi:serine/threonine protein phosphatase 1